MRKSIRKFIYLGLAAVITLVSISFINATETLAQTKTKRAKSVPRRVSIPVGTNMKIRLENEIDTNKANNGDPFTAIVLTPVKYADSTIDGHVAKINKSGKMTGRTELVLTFDRIRLSGGQTIPMAAQVVKIYGEDSKQVDEEGNIKSGSQGKSTAVRAGGGAALGAIIGGIAGGGKGAAIGAAAGAGAGAGSVFITGSQKVKLEPGTEILIRTTK